MIRVLVIAARDAVTLWAKRKAVRFALRRIHGYLQVPPIDSDPKRFLRLFLATTSDQLDASAFVVTAREIGGRFLSPEETAVLDLIESTALELRGQAN